jgi:hypothetical protein
MGNVPLPDGRKVSAGNDPDLEGGHVRRVIQVLGVALMVAGFLVDRSLRSGNRRAGRTSDEPGTSRFPLLLFWIGAVLLVLGSI